MHAKQQGMESPDAQEVQETNEEQKGDQTKKGHELEDPQAMTPGDEDIPIRPVMCGTPSMSESIEAELDDVEWRAKAKRHEPITREQFMGYFDCDGRIVDENELRRTIFKGMRFVLIAMPISDTHDLQGSKGYWTARGQSAHEILCQKFCDLGVL